MNDFKRKLILSSFIEQEYKLDQIATGSEWFGRYRVIKFYDRSVNVVSARWDFELFCFVELSVVTDIGLEYIKLI